MKQKTQVFNAKIIHCKFTKELFSNSIGKLYPPKKKIAINVDIKTILLYSAKKKNTKGTLECSVKKPETNSDSASTKSNGVRFNSARDEIKNIINKGNKGTTYQILSCNSIIVEYLKLPVKKITPNIAAEKTNS